MLDNKTIKQICDFVHTKPRIVQEVAHYIGKNWRTADRYITKIAQETGSLGVRTLRGGTRGAIKIVYWKPIESIHSLEFQERLFKRIEHSHRKDNFSPLDIFQYVKKDKGHAYLVEEKGDDKVVVDKDLCIFELSPKTHHDFFRKSFLGKYCRWQKEPYECS